MGASRGPIVAFISCATLAGGNAVCIRLSNRELDPLWGAGLRFAVAAGLLWIVIAITRRPVPSGRAFLGACTYGLLNFAGAFALAYYGLVRVPAGTGGVLLALVPLLTLGFAALGRQEQVTRRGVLGGLLAVAGVAVISAETLSTDVPLLSLIALLGSAACFAAAAVVVRGFPDADPFAANAVGMTAAAAGLIAASAIANESLALPERATTWYALAYLVPVGSVVVFALFLYVIQRWSASRATYIDVLIPISTAIAAAWILDEPIGLELVTGGCLIITGTVIGAIQPHEPREPRGIGRVRSGPSHA
jgi:drug/metabolite transporter (DMT)-like permease